MGWHIKVFFVIFSGTIPTIVNRFLNTVDASILILLSDSIHQSCCDINLNMVKFCFLDESVKNCVEGISGTFGYTCTCPVTCSTITTFHFRVIMFIVEQCSQFGHLVPQFHDFLSSAHMILSP